jgi:hypothetical protein
MPKFRLNSTVLACFSLKIRSKLYSAIFPLLLVKIDAIQSVAAIKFNFPLDLTKIAVYTAIWQHCKPAVMSFLRKTEKFSYSLSGQLVFLARFFASCVS